MCWPPRGRAASRSEGNAERAAKCREASSEARKERAQSRARDLAPVIFRLVGCGKSYREIADEFNSDGIASPHRKGWRANGILRIVAATAAEFGSAVEITAARSLTPGRMRAKKLEKQIGPILLQFRNEGLSYPEMAANFDRQGISSPWGRPWGGTSIWRYMKRALNVKALRPLHERYVGKLLKRLGFSHISARPRHPVQDGEIIEAFKKTSCAS